MMKPATTFRMMLPVAAFSLSILSSASLLATEAGSPVKAVSAADAYRADAIKTKALALLKGKDYEGLEAYATELRAVRAGIFDSHYPLDSFYSGVANRSDDKEPARQARKAELDAWLAAKPDSIGAKTALMDWWIDYAWNARGTGWASTVTEEGWRLMAERLEEAKKLSDDVIAHGNKVDVAFYRIAISIPLGNKGSFEEVMELMNAGREIEPNYLKLYTMVSYFLSPKWCGELGDVEDFASRISHSFKGDEADFVFAAVIDNAVDSRLVSATPQRSPSQSDALVQGIAALLLRGNSEDAETGRATASLGYNDFFVRNPDSYDRIKRGFEVGIARTNEDYIQCRWGGNLAKFATLKGDQETAIPLFLEWGRHIWRNNEGGYEVMLAFREASGAQKVINEVVLLEKEGKLEEAEARYRAFSSKPSWSDWLSSFYLRQGLAEKYYQIKGGEKKDDPNTANMNHLAVSIYTALMLNDWDYIRVAAERFDKERPWNLIGRGALFLEAARQGDAEAGKRLKQSFLENKTNRPALKAAQTVLSGEKTLQEVAPQLTKDDGFNQQAAMVIVGWYLSQGEREKAREALELLKPTEPKSDTAAHLELFRCLQYGSLRGLIDGPQS